MKTFIYKQTMGVNLIAAISSLFMLCSLTGMSQNVNIPDAAFKAELVNNPAINTNLDAEIQVSEAAAFTGTINVNTLSIADLTGIEAFTALTYLTCNNNSLTSINLTANTALTTLYCENNNLTSLDISANTALQYLYCDQNSITSLDVSTNTALLIINCSDNSITSLDVSANTVLQELYCDYNQLSSLDLSANTSLVNVSCSANSLATLTIAGATALSELDCNTNLLTSLSIATNTAITELICYNNTLTTLDLRNGNNTNIISFYAYDNPGLTCIAVDNVAWSATHWTVGNGNISNYQSFSTDCTPVYIPDANFKDYLTGYSSININEDTEIQVSEAAAFTGTINANSYGIADMTGLEAFTSLTELFCANNSLTSLDVSANTALTLLSCGNNSLTSLDVSANTALTALACTDNALTYLNMQNGNNAAITEFYATNNPALSCIQVDNPAWATTHWTNIDNTSSFSLNCNVNIPDANFKAALLDMSSINTNHDAEIQLSEAPVFTGTIDVSGNNIADLTGIEAFTAITQLNCSENSLTSLNVSANTALTSLNCSANSLAGLFDVSANTALTYLACDANYLTGINVAANTALVTLYCNDNALTTLNVSTNTALTLLDCRENLLTALNVSANTALQELNCRYNQLGSLNVSANTALQNLYCNDNLLTTLDVSVNTNLTDFYCSWNQLTSLNVKNGNNTNLSFGALGNTNLTCIQVDDVTWATTNWSAQVDHPTAFSLNCYITVGIPEENNALVVYPNPAGNFITVGNNSNKGQSTVRIFNAQGQVVLQLSINNQQSTIDISALSSGVYYLSLNDGKQEMRSKIIKQ